MATGTAASAAPAPRLGAEAGTVALTSRAVLTPPDGNAIIGGRFVGHADQSQDRPVPGTSGRFE
ncbi:hypothetical protein G3N56_19740 [Desulfovibrio sulfodismutans]|uniref:Uncharacterized protein n=1 Tax=Desulfolutivibrio sulfodismutans TaxID=63561 RepID=A0A7K3NT61_9BACT|nr:hypothetical protein [Desulfolutivibrio sulfodismutans]